MIPNRDHHRKRKLLFAPIIIIALFAITGIVMLLWNNLIPEIFHLSAITYWQAMGLLVLCRILFGKFHFRKPDRRGHPFRNPEFREKFMNMTREEKQEFKEQWKQRFRRRL